MADLVWIPICDNAACRFVMKPVTLDLDAALSIPNQCPRCLSVLDLTRLAEQILKLVHPDWCPICFQPTCADSRVHA
jgi:hypothetical protein